MLTRSKLMLTMQIVFKVHYCETIQTKSEGSSTFGSRDNLGKGKVVLTPFPFHIFNVHHISHAKQG